MKDVLVTGGEGYIGSNLVNRLEDEGYDVVTLDIKSGQPVQFIEKTIRYTPDIIFHLAAQSRVQPSFRDPKQCFSDNVEGTMKVLEFARKKGCKVVYAGSSSKHHSPEDSPYSCTKFLGEELCKMYRSSFGVDVEIARFYNVYGGNNQSTDPKLGNLMGIWISKAEAEETLQVVGDGEQRRDFIHVDDIVDGLIRIAESLDSHEDAWDLGTGINYSVNEILEMFKTRFPDVKSEYIPDQKGNYRETLSTSTDARDRLDWKPEDRLEDYINRL